MRMQEILPGQVRGRRLQGGTEPGTRLRVLGLVSHVAGSPVQVCLKDQESLKTENTAFI